MANFVHPGFSEIPNDQSRPESLYRIRCGRGRHATMGVTTSSAALADTPEGEELTPGGEDGAGGGEYEEIYLLTVPSMATVSPMDELILANRDERVRWDAFNKHFYSVLFLCTKGVANSFFVRFGGRPDSRQRPDGQGEGRAMGKKYLNSLMQRRCILMRKLNGMTMMLNQNLYEYLAESRMSSSTSGRALRMRAFWISFRRA